MPFIIVILFVAVFIALAVASNRKLTAKRAAMQSEIDSMRSQMQSYVEQCQGLDEKTRERVSLAQQNVEVKLEQATGLLRAAVKDRHFERIGRIFALVHTKLENVQASIGRSQTRFDERVQRQAEVAARRVGSFGQKSGAGSSRMGSFAPPAEITNADTAWSTIPLNERGACFFCSRPCVMRELTPVIVPLGGVDRRVLACPSDFAAVRSGTIPPIRSFSENGRPVPWYAYHRYDPYDDYYGGGDFIFVDTYPYSAFDSGYWNFNGAYANGGPSYNFSPDTEAYQDYSSGLAAGSIMGGDNVGSVDFEGANNTGDFGPETVGPDIS